MSVPFRYLCGMRSCIIILFSLLLLATSCAGPKEEVSFFTEGNCEDCKALIEAAVKDMSGVESVSWDYETSLTTVIYSLNRTSENQLQEAIAEKGFETQFFPANEDARANLPECCRQKIDRTLKSGQSLPPGH